jgi:hypothetical protein
MRFGETVKLTAPDLVISRRHDAWLMQNDHPAYSERALRFAHMALTKPDRVRVGTISASSLGECPRAQQFVYLGMPQLPPDQKGAMKMQNGFFMHLRWQMAGLTEGWLSRAEVPIGTNHYNLSGTMDGICYDDSVLELKSINMNGFGRVQTFGPLLPHLFQMATYMLVTQRERGIFLYECKDNQEYKEIVLRADELPLAEAAEQAEVMWQSVRQQALFEPLNKCIDKEGYLYHSCPFRDRCLSIHRWEEVA